MVIATVIEHEQKPVLVIKFEEKEAIKTFQHALTYVGLNSTTFIEIVRALKEYREPAIMRG